LVSALFSPSPLAGEGGSRIETGEGLRDAPMEGGATPHPPAIPQAPSPARGEGEAQRWTEAPWPKAEFIVGNPPFLGGKKLRRDLGDDAVEALFKVYDGRVPREADLVCYWFEKAWRQMQAGHVQRVGFVSTNSIRGGKNRDVLMPIAEAGQIFEAWADEPWVVDGASVRVSLVCFGEQTGKRLDGKDVEQINADLSGAEADVVTAKALRENSNIAFQGPVLIGEFEVPSELARSFLREPLNPNGRPNSDVVLQFLNGKDIVQTGRDFWVVDFKERSQEDASLYEQPFNRIVQLVKPQRASNNRERRRTLWWKHGDLVPKMWEQTSTRSRVIFSPRVSKYRIFTWVEPHTLPDSRLVSIVRDDDTAFGILHSSYHECWSFKTGGWHGVGNDPQYTPTASFETFPFPEGLTPNIPASDYAADPRAIRIAAAARRLDELRRNWLYPADLGDWTPEIIPTAALGEAPRKYPDRFIAKNVEAQAKLKLRTLTNLYNQRPQWLADAHATLDQAVAAAYGWPEDISTDEALEKLLALNLERAAAGR
jgi:type II restriction/modification system DNA methylase subunit YeeA